MFLNKNEVRAINQMLEYHDETGDTSTLNEIIGVVRFKLLEDIFDREDEEKRKEQKKTRKRGKSRRQRNRRRKAR